MSNGIIGLLAGLGVGAYVYNIMYKNTGGNAKTALIVGGIAGAFVWVGILIVLNVVLN